MATFPCSGALLAALLQAPASLAALRARLAHDSADGRGWLLLGRADLARFEEARARRPAPDRAGARAVLDTVDQALARAALLLGPPGATPEGDSAQVLRVAGWSGRRRLAGDGGGSGVATAGWGPLPPDLRLSPVLEELGEHLLRDRPSGGGLVTGGEADGAAAWYMRFARGLRPDLLVLPLPAWRADPGWRARVAADLRLGARGAGEGWVAALAARRAVCASMALEGPPEGTPRAPVAWQTRTLVWVVGRGAPGDRVPPGDFAFTALKLALAPRDPWAEAALALYARAARATPELCAALAAAGVPGPVECAH